VVDCAANGGYSATTNVAAGNFIINKATPTLSVTNSPVTYDGSAKSATVTGSVAGTPSSVLTGGAANQTNAGTYAVTANFTPTDTTNYNSLTAASAGNFIINKANQATVTVSAPASATYGQTGLSATALGGSGTGAYSYDSPGSTACTVNSSTGGLTITSGTGTCSITAIRTADSNYNVSATSAAATVTINKASQTIGTITFTPASLAVSGTTTASATATSSLAVSFSSDTPAVCTVSGNVVTGVSAGTCTIRAAQAGDGNFNAAPEVTQPLTVTGASSSTVTLTMVGTGTGTVNSSSNPASADGITCPGDCTGVYTSGTVVTLMATPDWKSDFIGWTVGCTGTNSNCIFTPSGNTGVIATFNYKPLVMMPGPAYYATIQDAYNAAAEAALLQGRDQTFTEDLVFDRTINVTFEGGNDATWNVVGDTTINGTVTMGGVAGGSVTISNMIIQ